MATLPRIDNTDFQPFRWTRRGPKLLGQSGGLFDSRRDILVIPFAGTVAASATPLLGGTAALAVNAGMANNFAVDQEFDILGVEAIAQTAPATAGQDQFSFVNVTALQGLVDGGSTNQFKALSTSGALHTTTGVGLLKVTAPATCDWTKFPAKGYLMVMHAQTASAVCEAVQYDNTAALPGPYVVTGASNASPIVITTSANHNLTVGQSVNVSGVLGNTGANGTFTVTVVNSATTFTLGSSTTGGAWTSGGIVTVNNIANTSTISYFNVIARAAFGTTAQTFNDAGSFVYPIVAAVNVPFGKNVVNLSFSPATSIIPGQAIALICTQDASGTATGVVGADYQFRLRGRRTMATAYPQTG